MVWLLGVDCAQSFRVSLSSVFLAVPAEVLASHSLAEFLSETGHGPAYGLDTLVTLDLSFTHRNQNICLVVLCFDILGS